MSCLNGIEVFKNCQTLQVATVLLCTFIMTPTVLAVPVMFTQT